MTREEIKQMEDKALLVIGNRYSSFCPTPQSVLRLCKLAREALDKRDAVKKQEIVNDTADTNSFHAGGTGYGAYQTRE